MEKILITGTGRCGTTFLIKLFSFLEFDTGYTKENYKQFIFSNCNSGMERAYTEPFSILKNPTFIHDMEGILKDTSVKIKTIIVPIRDLKRAAISRVKHANLPGGLWNAEDESSQIQYYKDILSNYLYVMTKYDKNTIFLDFDKMTTDKSYLFNKIKPILDEKKIVFELFCTVYDEVLSTSV
jgi:hypothetical protein